MRAWARQWGWRLGCTRAMCPGMKIKIAARKRIVTNWIDSKFGSLETLANLAGIDTSRPEVRNTLTQIRTSRDPVQLRISWRNAVIQIDLMHHTSPKEIGTIVESDNASSEE